MATIYSYALCSLSDVKETLGITSSTYDNLLIRKINQATDMIERYCGGRRFAETTYTEEGYDGSGIQSIILKQRPITSFTSLEVRNGIENTDSWDAIDSELYFVDNPSATIDLLFTARRYPKHYRVTYDAGYTTIPADLQEACVTLAAHLYENSATGSGVKKKKEGQREIEYFDSSSGNGNSNIFQQLQIDDVLDTYSNYPILNK